MQSQRTVWQRVHTIWVWTGLTLTAVFVTWCLVAYRASPEAQRAMVSDDAVQVAEQDGVWTFATHGVDSSLRGLIFYPGAMVDPVAYAPLMRAVAVEGYPVFIVQLPKRGAFGGADDPRVLARTMRVMQQQPATREWILAGHSRGAVVTATMASRQLPRVVGIVLIGTTHPRDVDLSALPIAVTKVVGSRDGVAPMARSDANRHLLPTTTTWVLIEGGNHSQFGSYGFQPMDRFSTISREKQQRVTVDAILQALAR